MLTADIPAQFTIGPRNESMLLVMIHHSIDDTQSRRFAGERVHTLKPETTGCEAGEAPATDQSPVLNAAIGVESKGTLFTGTPGDHGFRHRPVIAGVDSSVVIHVPWISVAKLSVVVPV